MTKLTEMNIWNGNSRGVTDIGWLKSLHSFSFGEFNDAERNGFRSLRVINDDVITGVLEGKIVHQDSMGTQGELDPGDLQLMSAGTGIHHSEMNGLDDGPTRFLQIWIEPEVTGTSPEYQQRSFDPAGRADRWQLIASPDARDGALRIGQDVFVSVMKLSKGGVAVSEIAQGRSGYLHVAFGQVQVGDRKLAGGDAISFTGESAVEIVASEESELLFFDLV